MVTILCGSIASHGIYMKVIIINSILWLCFVIIATVAYTVRAIAKDQIVFIYLVIGLLYRAGLFAYANFFACLLSSNLSNCRNFFTSFLMVENQAVFTHASLSLPPSLAHRIVSDVRSQRRQHIIVEKNYPSTPMRTSRKRAKQQQQQPSCKRNLCRRRD